MTPRPQTDPQAAPRTAPARTAGARTTALRERAAAFSAVSYVEAMVASAARCTRLSMEPRPVPETDSVPAAAPRPHDASALGRPT